MPLAMSDLKLAWTTGCGSSKGASLSSTAASPAAAGPDQRASGLAQPAASRRETAGGCIVCRHGQLTGRIGSLQDTGQPASQRLHVMLRSSKAPVLDTRRTSCFGWPIHCSTTLMQLVDDALLQLPAVSRKKRKEKMSPLGVHIGNIGKLKVTPSWAQASLAVPTYIGLSSCWEHRQPKVFDAPSHRQIAMPTTQWLV